MAKKKLSFDIDTDVYEKMKVLLEKYNVRQGDFLREAVEKYIEEYEGDIVTLYIVDDGTLTKKAFDIKDYEIEVDNSCLTKDIIDDCGFIQSGYLTKNNQKIRFYARRKIK